MRTLLLACAAAFLFVGCPKETAKTPEAPKTGAPADVKTPAEAAKPAETK